MLPKYTHTQGMAWPVFVCPSLCTALTCSDQYLVWDLLAGLGFDVSFRQG